MADRQQIEQMNKAELQKEWDREIDAWDAQTIASWEEHDELIGLIMDRLDFLTGVTDGQRVLALEGV